MAYQIYSEDVQAVRVEPGIARGAFDLATRGTGIHVTCWPNRRNQLRPLPWNHYRGVPYWNQEWQLFVAEVTPQIQETLNKDWAWSKVGKLIAAIEAVPEDQAILEDASDPSATCEERAERRAGERRSIWKKPRKQELFKSAFCNGDVHSSCKQIDCECECHTK